MDTIRTQPAPLSQPQVDFSWAPVGAALVLVVGDEVYSNDAVDPTLRIVPPEFTTPVNTELTFAADVVMPVGVEVIEYRWDFGDGVGGYGETVAHTYRVPSHQTRCVLTVLDSTARLTTGAHQMNLRPAALVRVEDLQAHALPA